MLDSQSSQPAVDTPAASTEGSGRDNRWSRRQSCLAPAEISSVRMHQSIACVVRDTSASGARIEIPTGGNAFAAGPERIPDQITLTMPRDRISVECRVTWRKGSFMGVRYLGPARVLPRKAPSQMLNQAPRKQASLIGKLFR